MREKTLLRGILDYYSTNTYTEKTTHIIKSIRIMHIEMCIMPMGWHDGMIMEGFCRQTGRINSIDFVEYLHIGRATKPNI